MLSYYIYLSVNRKSTLLLYIFYIPQYSHTIIFTFLYNGIKLFDICQQVKLRVIVSTSSNASTTTQVLVPKSDNNNNNNNNIL